MNLRVHRTRDNLPKPPTQTTEADSIKWLLGGNEKRGTELLFSEIKSLRFFTLHSLVPCECITLIF